MLDDPKPPRSPLLKSQTRQANWRRANLRKYTAHLAVQRALVSGTLEKKGCEMCGSETVDAHHDRYDEPLNVRWLCRRTVKEVRQCWVGDEKAAELQTTYGLDWAVRFEARELQTCWCCVHGDLHGENILVDAGSKIMIIDYANYGKTMVYGIDAWARQRAWKSSCRTTRMRFTRSFIVAVIASAAAVQAGAEPVPVNSDNFIRAESDLYFSAVVGRDRFGKFGHDREMTTLDKQEIIRLNRDTLYSSAVFDLDAGPVTVTLPDAGGRFMSMQVFDQDHYTHGVYYEPATYTFTREEIGTRYVFPGIRILANPEDPEDMKAVHALQDKITAEQPGGPGTFEIPDWDNASRDKTRAIILQLAEPLPDTRGMFGARDEVDPVRHFIGTAMGWGGNPEADALYLNRSVARNDGKTVYRLNVGEVPVKGFWSISIYNAQGFYEPNEANAYTINNLTADKDANGGVTVQFGGCEGKIPNCLPTPEGWNWMVRLYRPEAQILDGSWTFPEAEAVQ